jgi:hypothetical protein
VTDDRPLGYDWAFVGLTFHSFIFIRTWVVYVSDRLLAMAFVRGVLPPVSGPEWEDQWAYPRPYLLRRHAGLDVNEPAFLRSHRLNYHIRRTDLADVAFDPRRRWDLMSVPHSGRIILYLRDGRSHELILLGFQDGPAIRDRLRPALPAAVAARGQRWRRLLGLPMPVPTPT